MYKEREKECNCIECVCLGVLHVYRYIIGAGLCDDKNRFCHSVKLNVTLYKDGAFHSSTYTYKLPPVKPCLHQALTLRPCNPENKCKAFSLKEHIHKQSHLGAQKLSQNDEYFFQGYNINLKAHFKNPTKSLLSGAHMQGQSNPKC